MPVVFVINGRLLRVTLPLKVPPANVGLADVLISCGSEIVTVLPLTDATTPLVLANVNVPPPATEPVPLVPVNEIVVLTALVVMPVIRPLLSTTIVGIEVALP